jgi:hypothetical protein
MQNPPKIFFKKKKSIIILHFKNTKRHFKLDFYWLNILSLLDCGGENAKPTYIFLHLKKIKVSSYMLRMQSHILSWISNFLLAQCYDRPAS